jgi:hypothetical protein
VVGAGTGKVLEEAPEADALQPEFTPSKGEPPTTLPRGFGSCGGVACSETGFVNFLNKSSVRWFGVGEVGLCLSPPLFEVLSSSIAEERL